jgi:glycerol-3-phosphate acyltransferase PlsY
MVGETWASLTILVTAVIGCNWPIWLRRAGGQGQTIGMVGLVILAPIAMLVAASTYVVPQLVTRKHLLSNTLFHLGLPLVLWLMEGSWEWGLAGFLIVAPFLVKQWTAGDDVVRAREAHSVGHNGAGV